MQKFSIRKSLVQRMFSTAKVKVHTVHTMSKNANEMASKAKCLLELAM